MEQESMATFSETYFLRSNSFKSSLSLTEGYCILMSLHPDQAEPATPMEHEPVSHYRKQTQPRYPLPKTTSSDVSGRGG